MSSSPVRPPSRWLPWLLPVLLLVAWEAASKFGWLSTRVLPEPWSVLQAFWRLAVSGELMAHVLTSTWRALTGFALADRVLLVEDGHIVLDEPVPLPRPRVHGDAAGASITRRVLTRVLSRAPVAPNSH